MTLSKISAFLKSKLFLSLLAISVTATAGVVTYKQLTSTKNTYLQSESKTHQKDKKPLIPETPTTSDDTTTTTDESKQDETPVVTPDTNGNSSSSGSTSGEGDHSDKGDHTVSIPLGNFTLEIYETNNQFGIRVPGLYDKYLYFNSKDYGKLMRKIDPTYNGPESFSYTDTAKNQVSFTESEKTYLKDEYAKFIVDQLKDDQFTEKPYQTYTIEGKKLNLKEITMSLSESDIKDILTKLLDKMIGDQKLQNMIADKIFQDKSLSELGMDKDSFKKEFVTFLKDAKEPLDVIRFPKGFKSTILITSDKYIVRRIVDFGYTYESQNMSMHLVTNSVEIAKGNTVKSLSLQVKQAGDSDSEYVFGFRNQAQDTPSGKKRTLTVTANMLEGGMTLLKANFALNALTTGTVVQTTNSSYRLAFDGMFATQLPTPITGKVQTIIDTRNNKNLKFNFTLNTKVNEEPLNLTFKMDADLNKSNITGLTSKNSVNVASASESELMKVFSTISTNFDKQTKQYGMDMDESGY